MKLLQFLVVAFSAFTLAACSSDDGGTKEGGGSSEIFINGNGNTLTFIDNDVDVKGENNNGTIDQFNGDVSAEEECTLSEETCAELEGEGGGV